MSSRKSPFPSASRPVLASQQEIKGQVKSGSSSSGGEHDRDSQPSAILLQISPDSVSIFGLSAEQQLKRATMVVNNEGLYSHEWRDHHGRCQDCNDLLWLGRISSRTKKMYMFSDYEKRVYVARVQPTVVGDSTGSILRSSIIQEQKEVATEIALCNKCASICGCTEPANINDSIQCIFCAVMCCSRHGEITRTNKICNYCRDVVAIHSRSLRLQHAPQQNSKSKPMDKKKY